MHGRVIVLMTFINKIYVAAKKLHQLSLAQWVGHYLHRNMLTTSDTHVCMYYNTCRAVSTTVDPFRDISLDLAPSSIVNRMSTPVEVSGECMHV